MKEKYIPNLPDDMSIVDFTPIYEIGEDVTRLPFYKTASGLYRTEEQHGYCLSYNPNNRQVMWWSIE